MKHFTLTELKMLHELLSEKENYQDISKIIGKSISSIPTEIKNNSITDPENV